MVYAVFTVTRAQSKVQKREKQHVDVYKGCNSVYTVYKEEEIGVIICKLRKGRKKVDD